MIETTQEGEMAKEIGLKSKERVAIWRLLDEVNDRLAAVPFEKYTSAHEQASELEDAIRTRMEKSVDPRRPSTIEAAEKLAQVVRQDVIRLRALEL